MGAFLAAILLFPLLLLTFAIFIFVLCIPILIVGLCLLASMRADQAVLPSPDEGSRLIQPTRRLRVWRGESSAEQQERLTEHMPRAQPRPGRAEEREAVRDAGDDDNGKTVVPAAEDQPDSDVDTNAGEEWWENEQRDRCNVMPRLPYGWSRARIVTGE
ncbi:uncharacterized protein Z520_01648 [Fonsecaea multimorphosa CBS 102226]|uniref:Uncharacterized protein n=1 Tax=Fonsecaea multimorphosa CBS 102226 TaxID=1442371 RepID=A0A0D2HMU5_9EURO|nr:uncharacterized protein Z520_01648 [Fonsecaea multimorphosa CBS 102226]KIY03181.1 hypothetical protein Z520_01648 [Fonsecaea multimorphosa CBS 102226]OAL30424.1 hypothetical protein AYO22_01622 [Fonsecaea multimorphosa]